MNILPKNPALLRQINIAGILTCILLFVTPVRADDFDIVAERVRNTILAEKPFEPDIQKTFDTLRDDGTWPDIPYESRNTAIWEPQNHLLRLIDLYRAWENPGELAGNPELKAKIIAAYDAWTSRRPRSANWFYNDIFVPEQMSRTLVLLAPHLTKEQFDAGDALTKRSYVPRHVNSGTNTGANRVARALAVIYRAVAEKNKPLLKTAFASIGDTLVDGKPEGFQPDNSFLQHGPQLYIQGYGAYFTWTVLIAGSFNYDTEYAFTPEQFKIIADYILDGAQHFIRGDTIDYTASGREISRQNVTAATTIYLNELRLLAKIAGNYRKKEIQAFLTRLENSLTHKTADPALALSGNKVFPYADAATHQRREYYAGVRASSVRTFEPETGNNENIKGLHLGDGVTLIMRTGNEYDDIAPVWDWKRLPGTTVEQDKHRLKPPRDWGVRGTSTFTGGVSDGTYGNFAFDYSKLNISAKKSWFFFDNEFVALGAGINAPASKAEVNTTLNQTLLNGTVTYKSDTIKTLPHGKNETVPALRRAHHDKIGYFFPQPAPATIRTATQTDDWRSINHAFSGKVSKDVFTLCLNHGKAFTGESYAYIVVPGINESDMEKYEAALPTTINILSNTETVQAVRHEKLGITQAVFWQDAEAQTGGITANKKCAVMVKTDREFTEISVSDPTQQNKETVKIKVAGTFNKTPISAPAGVAVTITPAGAELEISVENAAGKTFRTRLKNSTPANNTRFRY